MEKYNLIIPGAAERILCMAEESLKYQQTITTAAISAQSADIRRGQWFAFLIAAGALGVGVVAILNGSPRTGAIIICTALAGGVGTFILSRRSGQTPAPSDNDPV